MSSKNKNGFSLVELIITVGILMGIMAVVSGLMMQMTNASANQRRRQAQHVNEEQARTALLNIVRDVRRSNQIPDLTAISPPPPVSQLTLTNPGEQFILTAPHLGRGSTITIIYELEDDPDGDFYTGNYILTRTLLCDSGVAIDFGIGSNDWPNPFQPVALQEIRFDMEYADLVEIELEIWIPRIGNEAGTFETDADGIEFRRWSIESEATTQRRPN